MKIELWKTYRTHNGKSVRLYAIDGRTNYPVHGAVLGDEGWGIQAWVIDGRFNKDDGHPHMHDLVEVKPRHKRTVWLNFYKNGAMSCWESKSVANSMAENYGGRLACVSREIDFEEGEGL